MRGEGLSAVAISALVLALTTGQAQGQALERNIAPGPREAAPKPLLTPITPEAQDDTPLGPALKGLELLDAASTAPPEIPLGIDYSNARIKHPRRLARRLKVFLGKPISRKILSEIQAEIVELYRKQGRPFVSVYYPPQDITGGGILVRIAPFRLGAKTIAGAGEAQAKAIASAIRARTGAEIDAPKLEEDLTWLNHAQFSQVSAVFSPGRTTGQTDLALNVQSQNPWSLFAGWANSGSSATGYDRYLTGIEIGNLIRSGSLLSYEHTSSGDVWDKGDQSFSHDHHLRYASNSLVASLPLAPRQDLTISIDAIETEGAEQVFDLVTSTEEAGLVYRSALSNLSRLPGDLSLGLEMRSQLRDTFFGAVSVVKTPVVVMQGLAGWSVGGYAFGGTETFSTTLRYSPGGQGGRNSDDAFASFTRGRVLSSSYVYGQANWSGDFPVCRGWRYTPQVSVQISDHALLNTEQMAIGGLQAVRSYGYDDQSYDSAIISRNQVRAPPINGPRLAALPSSFSPFVFLDAGYGWNHENSGIARVAGTGFGTDLQIGKYISAGATAAFALTNASFTHEGHFKVLGHVTFNY